MDVPTHLPEAPEDSGQPQRLAGVAALEAPIEGRTHVVVIDLEAVEPLASLRTEQVRLRGLCQGDEGFDVAVANRVGFTAFLEALDGEVANGLQHQKARLVEVR